MKNFRWLGSALLLSSTAIGAGMVALPLASVGLGLPVTLTVLIVLWFITLYTALLMLELYQYVGKCSSLFTLTQAILGLPARRLASGATLLLFYSLCAAYISGAGEQLANKLVALGVNGLTPQAASALVTVMIALILTRGTGVADTFNRWLFACKIALFFTVVYLVSPTVSQERLISQPLGMGVVLGSLPIIFTSFGFHGCIATLFDYLDGELKYLKRAIIFGSVIPLMLYIIWEWVTLGNLSQPQLQRSGGINGLVGSLSEVTHVAGIHDYISSFASLALLTSFLGVSMGLKDFIVDMIQTQREGLAPRDSYPVVATLLPPLLFAWFFPDGFIFALGFSSIFLVIIAIFLPLAMIMKKRRLAADTGAYQVRGGASMLGLVALTGMSIVVAQLAVMAGWT